MSALSLYSSLQLLFILESGVDCFFASGILRYQFSYRDAHDLLILEQYHFNKQFLAQYNSTLGKYTGNTEKAQVIANALNKNPGLMEQKRRDLERSKTYVPLMYKYILDTTAKPYVRLRSVEPASARHPAMLVCSAYDFYPKPIKLTWLKNGKEVTSDVTSTEELANGNWFYQIHSHLEYMPTSGEKVTCMVEHASLTEPKLYYWDPMMPESQKNKIAMGTAGLLLGVVFLAAGVIYYRKKSTAGRVLVPTS